MAKKMGFFIVPFSQLDNEQLEKIRFCEGEAIMFIVDDYKYIFYNDINNNLTRQRFSIFHEIGHYVLGHKCESELSKSEADFFARYAIAPIPLVWYSKADNIVDICHIFDVSFECSVNVKYNLDNWKRISKGKLKDYEQKLIDLFTYKI